MTSLPRWADDCVEPLSRLAFTGRASRFSPQRAAILRKAELEKSLKKAKDGAAQGRLLRLLGRDAEAKKLLDVAAKKGSPLAKAALWEMGGSPDLLDEAIKAEPKNPAWRLWRAVEWALRSPEAAAKDAAEAKKLGANAGTAGLVEAIALKNAGRLKEAAAAAAAALRADPTIEWGWRLSASLRHALGDKKALDDARTALRLSEYLPAITALFDDPAIKGLEPHAAIRALDAYLSKNPKHWWAYALRADFKRFPGVNDHVAALSDMKLCLEGSPNEPWALAYLTRCQITVGDWPGARKSIERAGELWPDCGWIAAWKGEHLRRANKTKEALKELDRAKKLDPDYEFVYAWRGGALRQAGKPKLALPDLDVAIALKPDYVEWCYFERTMARRELGRVSEALEDLEFAHAINSKYVWEQDPKRLEPGLKELEKHLKKEPKDGLARRWQGDVLIRLRRFEEAEQALQKACKLRPKDPEARVLRGRALGELDRWDEAFEDFDQGVALAPESALALAWRGRALLVSGRAAEALPDLASACALDKGSVWMLAWKAEAESKLGRHEDSLATAETALALHPRYGEAAAWKGAALLALGREEEGRKELSRAESLSPGSLERLNLKLPAPLPSSEDAAAEADALVRQGRHEDAAALLGQLLEKDPGNERLLMARAEAWRCCGRYADAVKDCDALVKAKPGGSSLCARGEAKRHCFDFNGALADAEEALKLEPTMAGAWVLKSEAERCLGREKDAQASAQKAVEADQHWTWAPVVLAKALRQAGKIVEAEEPLAVAEAKGDPYAWGWRADVRRKAGKKESALQDAEKAVEARPTIAWFRALRGELKRDLGRPAEAWADVEEAVRIDGRCSCDYDFLGAEPKSVASDPHRAWVFAWRGGIHRREGRLPEAQRDLDRAAALDPNCFWAVAWRGELALHQGRAADALPDFERALKVHPDFVPALLWSGQALLLTGNPSAALPRYRKAAQLAPQDPWAHIGVGASLEALGKKTESMQAFARAKAIAPNLFSQLQGTSS